MLKIFRPVKEKTPSISSFVTPRVTSRVQALVTPARGPSTVATQMKQNQKSTPLLRRSVSPDPQAATARPSNVPVVSTTVASRTPITQPNSTQVNY